MIDIDDSEGPGGKRLGDLDYEALIAEGDPDYDWPGIEDEWQAIALSYTSGTTGDPKGVVYHARGVYIEVLGNVVTWAMPHRPVYLWTLPMFHALGWCFPWSVAIMGGTHVGLRKVEAGVTFQSIADNGVTYGVRADRSFDPVHRLKEDWVPLTSARCSPRLRGGGVDGSRSSVRRDLSGLNRSFGQAPSACRRRGGLSAMRSREKAPRAWLSAMDGGILWPIGNLSGAAHARRWLKI